MNTTAKAEPFDFIIVGNEKYIRGNKLSEIQSEIDTQTAYSLECVSNTWGEDNEAVKQEWWDKSRAASDKVKEYQEELATIIREL